MLIREAEQILSDAETLNPGPWIRHSFFAANAAGIIALHTPHLQRDHAYVCGLLHDIGRREASSGAIHPLFGYQFLLQIGHPDVARVCLTHPFTTKDIHESLVYTEIPASVLNEMQLLLESIDYDEYDWLTQLADSLCTAEGIVGLEERLADVESRHGTNPYTPLRRAMLTRIKDHFERLTGSSIDDLLCVSPQS